MASPIKWTPEHVAELRRLAAEGRTAAYIASETGFSRNAVIGAARRYAITLEWARKPAGTPRPGNRAGMRPKLPAVWVPSPTKPAPAPSARAPRPCLLVDLTPTSCRWPINDEWPHMFCGAPDADMARGVVYCRIHMRVAYHRPRGRPESPPVSPKLYLIR